MTSRLRFCRFLRHRRLQLGITQAEVAAAAGIASPDFISLVEQGRRRLELERVPRLARLLQLDPAELCRMALVDRAPHFAAQLLKRRRR